MFLISSNISPGPAAISGSRASPLLSARGVPPCYFGKQEVGTTHIAFETQQTGLLGWLLHEVLHLLMWWWGQATLVVARESSCAVLIHRQHPPWDYSILFPPTAQDNAVKLDGGRSFYSCNTVATGQPEGGVCSLCTPSSEDELRLRLRLSLVPGQTPLCVW
jgi:hypothetical protein